MSDRPDPPVAPEARAALQAIEEWRRQPAGSINDEFAEVLRLLVKAEAALGALTPPSSPETAGTACDPRRPRGNYRPPSPAGTAKDGETR